jgi:UDP-2-acetamido-2,6-beta-L-arabino-hexul-4-ose reductase
MKILITGAKGFVGRNLIAGLISRGFTDFYEFDKDSEADLLALYCKDADFVFHLAGVNRPDKEDMFMEGNADFTKTLIETLKKTRNPCPILYSSSVQAALDNPYGTSKRAGEAVLLSYAEETGAKVLIYRLPNLFGKWCRPGYNSVVATFCHNLARELPITLHNPDHLLSLVHIDDLTSELLLALEERDTRNNGFYEVSPVYQITLKELATLIRSFCDCRTGLTLPDMSDAFTQKLYSTYLTYLPEDNLSYPLKMNEDQRGSFTEFLKNPELGQLSVNIIKPGITKGNHWHNTKNEKFLVVSGRGRIRLRKLFTQEVIEYPVSAARLTIVEIPSGYAHNIENLGDTELVIIIWANESFDKNKPDTYFMEV